MPAGKTKKDDIEITPTSGTLEDGDTITISVTVNSATKPKVKLTFSPGGETVKIAVSEPGRSSTTGVIGRSVMDWRELREQCLALPGAVEEFPFGDEVSVFKVGGKMFALSHLDGEPLQVSVKCDPELAVQLRAAYAAIGPGYHLNKRHWNTITLDGSVADEMVGDLLGDSYDLVVASLPKARRPAGAGPRPSGASGV